MPACHAGDRRFESGRVRHRPRILPTPRPPARTGRDFVPGYPASVLQRVIVLLAILSIALGACAPSSPTGSPTQGPVATDTLSPTFAPTPTPSPSPTPEPTLTSVVRALVPVTSFRAPWTETTAAEVADVLAGTSKRYAAIEVVTDQREQIATAPRAGRLGFALSATALCPGRGHAADRHGRAPGSARVPARR